MNFLIGSKFVGKLVSVRVGRSLMPSFNRKLWKRPTTKKTPKNSISLFVRCFLDKTYKIDWNSKSGTKKAEDMELWIATFLLVLVSLSGKTIFPPPWQICPKCFFWRISSLRPIDRMSWNLDSPYFLDFVGLCWTHFHNSNGNEMICFFPKLL